MENKAAASLQAKSPNTLDTEEVFVFPTTVAQRRFWLLDQIEPGNPALNVPLAARLAGRLDRALIERAVNEIVRRHEILRTSFRMIEGEIMQVIHSERHIALDWYDITNCPGPECEDRVHQLMIQEGVRPFVLSKGPLLRGGLIKIRDDEHVLMLTMHHIGCDGWSNGVLMKEVAQIYSAFMLGVENYPELPLQYADFAQWQEEWLKGPDAAKQLQFWRSQLKGTLPVLNMPTDRPRGAQRSHAGAIHTLLLPSGLGEALKSLCSREDITPFMLFFATYATLLFRYTGNTDIIVGSPAANRTQADLENLIGLFANPLVLRLDLSGNPTFRMLLSRVKELSLEAFANQSYPFEKLVEEIQTNPARAGLPWLQAYFVFQKAFMTPQQMPELSLNPLRSISPGAMFEWSLGVLERNEGIRLQLEYNTDLYDQSTIDRMLHHFQRLLEGILADSSARICELPIMTPEEVRQLTVDWNQTELEVPRGRCVHELIEEQVRRTPEAVAAHGVGIQCSYLQMNARANQVAHFLRSHGVGPSSFVGLAVDDSSMEFLVGFLGILKAGGCCVFLDPQSVANLDRSIQPSGLGVLLTLSSSHAMQWSAGLKTVCFDTDASAIDSMPNDNLPNVVLPDQPACVRFSFDSSGARRGAVFSHSSMLNGAFGAWRELDLRPQDRIASAPNEVLPALLSGASIIFRAKGKEFSPEDWMDWIRFQHVTVAVLPTAWWHELVQMLGQNSDPAMGELRLIAIGGGRISPAALQTWQHATGGRIRLVDRFLVAEACGAAAFSEPISKGHLTARACIARPAPNLHIHLRDANLQPVPIGVPGDLYVSGGSIASADFASPGSSQMGVAFDSCANGDRDGLMATGERGRFLTDCGIELLGSARDLNKTNGFRLELQEIWSLLSRHPAVWQAVILPPEKPDRNGCVAYVIGKPNVRLCIEDLVGFLKEQLPQYMVPSEVIILERFPLTPDGALNVEAFPKQSPRDGIGAAAGAETANEIALAKIWCEVLGLKQIRPRDNFFDLGGHSLLAFRLINEMNRQLKLNVPVRTFFQYPTIEKLVRALPTTIRRTRKAELIQLNAGNSGPELIFLIDEGSLGLFKLAHRLGENLTMYASMVPLPEAAIQASVGNRLSELPRVEELAAAHATLIASRQINGPLLLAGHCFGGMLAFEVAHQLQRAGRKVETVLLLDTWMMRPTWWWRKRTWLQTHLSKLLHEGPRYVWGKGRRRVNLEKDGLIAQFNGLTEGNFSMHVPWSIIQRIYTQAITCYQPQALAADAFLFVSKDDWESSAFRRIDNSLGAERFFTEGVKVMDVPGNHVTVLDEANLPELSLRFTKGLELICKNLKAYTR